MQIKPVAAQDKPQWAQLWYAYLDFYDTSLPVSVYDKTFDALLSDDPHSPCGYLAWQGGQAVGLVHYLFHAHCWQPEGVCYLQDLFTTPQSRGTGAGRALISAVYAAADVRGKSSVYWMTQDFNATARKLYDKVGEVTPFIKYKRPA